MSFLTKKTQKFSLENSQLKYGQGEVSRPRGPNPGGKPVAHEVHSADDLKMWSFADFKQCGKIQSPIEFTEYSG